MWATCADELANRGVESRERKQLFGSRRANTSFPLRLLVAATDGDACPGKRLGASAVRPKSVARARAASTPLCIPDATLGG